MCLTQTTLLLYKQGLTLSASHHVTRCSAVLRPLIIELSPYERARPMTNRWRLTGGSCQYGCVSHTAMRTQTPPSRLHVPLRGFPQRVNHCQPAVDEGTSDTRLNQRLHPPVNQNSVSAGFQSSLSTQHSWPCSFPNLINLISTYCSVTILNTATPSAERGIIIIIN